MIRFIVLTLIVIVLSSQAYAFAPVKVDAIKIEGLQRLSEGTVLNYLPINVGDTIDASHTESAIRALFKSGFYNDIKLLLNGSDLIVKLVERPTIAAITFEGNEDISTEELTDALKSIGLTDGRVFNRSSLEAVERELERQYFSQGKYGIKITSTVDILDDNRVDILISLFEGDVAHISQINLVGSHAFEENALLKRFQLNSPDEFSFFSANDQYSKNKLAADLEVLRSYYLNNGYINFNIDSTQVSITPNKQDVYVTINVAEGDLFTIDSISLSGDYKLPTQELRDLVLIKTGDIFSRRALEASTNAISDRLSIEGYAFSNVNAIPDINIEGKLVSLTFYIVPGKRIYVRNINIVGNSSTRDDVIRREMRQMEGGWISTKQVNRSRIRMQKLGFFDEVNIETPVVPGINDQVDVNLSLSERPSGSLSAGLGFSDAQGLLLNASVSQNNVFGSGNRFSAAINNSSVNTVYSFSYTNPYYTQDGISRGFNVFSRATDAGAANVADFSSDVYGANVTFGFPLTEFNRASFTLGYEHTQLNQTSATPINYQTFIAENSDQFDIFKTSVSWSHDTRNRAIFPDRGNYVTLSGDVALPGSGLQYYQALLRGLQYIPVSKSFTALLKGQVAQGDGYGESDKLPFFEHYYVGGSQSVRGYRSNSLGPRDISGLPEGGSFKAVANAEMIFPIPFNEDNKSLRLSAFYDMGNVFSERSDFDVQELRSSTGLSVIWLTPIAPMTFSYSKALNTELDDEIEKFQFTLGSFAF